MANSTGVVRNFDWKEPKLKNSCDVFRLRNNDDVINVNCLVRFRHNQFENYNLTKSHNFQVTEIED